jgi:hypothetical protein
LQKHFKCYEIIIIRTISKNWVKESQRVDNDTEIKPKVDIIKTFFDPKELKPKKKATNPLLLIKKRAD